MPMWLDRSTTTVQAKNWHPGTAPVEPIIFQSIGDIPSLCSCTRVYDFVIERIKVKYADRACPAHGASIFADVYG